MRFSGWEWPSEQVYHIEMMVSERVIVWMRPQVSEGERLSGYTERAGKRMFERKWIWYS